MPRNSKCRRVCADFDNKIFAPQGFVLQDHLKVNQTNEVTLSDESLQCRMTEFVTINVEELEALRLCDLEGLEQEDAANRMGVSRGTLQRILYAARQKSAKALCEGMGVLIQGGNYEITNSRCDCSHRCKGCRMKKENEE